MDLEAVTKTHSASSHLYIGVESYPCSILEYNWETGRLERRFVLEDFPSESANMGLEGLAFVPSKTGETPESGDDDAFLASGLFYASSEATADLYIYKLPPKGQETGAVENPQGYLDVSLRQVTDHPHVTPLTKLLHEHSLHGSALSFSEGGLFALAERPGSGSPQPAHLVLRIDPFAESDEKTVTVVDTELGLEDPEGLAIVPLSGGGGDKEVFMCSDDGNIVCAKRLRNNALHGFGQPACPLPSSVGDVKTVSHHVEHGKSASARMWSDIRLWSEDTSHRLRQPTLLGAPLYVWCLVFLILFVCACAAVVWAFFRFCDTSSAAASEEGRVGSTLSMGRICNKGARGRGSASNRENQPILAPVPEEGESQIGASEP
uniref:Phytase-like domain-containing protein n=1 Tax=Chromera velia CCMP2878 TaxID=1169474 RepID=A0A0G4FED7_9ALVE|eukprot:Cvel_16500.t1-p1 / transcript=Cvel_16500.t1 / gene=Cvel_16500 / organism=Chromera_velia_CCMP2878 / gene_product=hypothetical protein / transcript_product=hypothetical protein / location=Cvel_scaffold1272:40045-41172(-) / protein_length=376 / sequence_SO=supercontig / SO=protein_coding / is_pseudo=false